MMSISGLFKRKKKLTINRFSNFSRSGINYMVGNDSTARSFHEFRMELYKAGRPAFCIVLPKPGKYSSIAKITEDDRTHVFHPDEDMKAEDQVWNRIHQCIEEGGDLGILGEDPEAYRMMKIINSQRTLTDAHLTPPSEKLAFSLIGGMIGDALGKEIEQADVEVAKEKYRGYDWPSKGYLNDINAIERLLITDDSQMTLFLLDGLLKAGGPTAPHAKVLPEVHKSLLRWKATQVNQFPELNDDIMNDLRLVASRGPGMTCLSIKPSIDAAFANPNESKGNGTIMRTAPVAFMRGDFPRIAMNLSLLTHGHRTASLCAAVWSIIIHELGNGYNFKASVNFAYQWAEGKRGNEETLSAINSGLTSSPKTPEEFTETFGTEGTADTTLAHAINACLQAEDIMDGYQKAVVHGGDSDTVGSVAGNALGLMFPEQLVDIHPHLHIECVDIALRLCQKWE